MCLMLVQIFPHPHCYLNSLLSFSNFQKTSESFPPYGNCYFHFSTGKLKLEAPLKEILSWSPNSDTAGIRSPDPKHPFQQFHQSQFYLLGWKHTSRSSGDLPVS